MKDSARRYTIACAVGALLVAGAGRAAAHTSFLYLAAGSRYLVVNPVDGSTAKSGRIQADRDVPGAIRTQPSTPVIVPTPGGRYVFFLYADLDLALVMDAETHEPVWSVELPTGTQSIQFSSMGETILAYIGGTSWIELPHRRGTITGPGRQAPSLSGGVIAFNRRATRVYGNRGNDLVFALTTSGSAVQTVRLQGGPYDWQISPNFRFLAGFTPDSIALVDEQRGRLIGYLAGSFAARAFHPSSRELYALTKDGDEIVVADTARCTEQRRIRPPFALSHLFIVDNGTLHGLSRGAANGNRTLILDIGGADRHIVLPAEFLEAGSELRAALVTVRPDAGFACF